MAGRTYKTRGIVLRKTKLGEKDLIVTLLVESGSIVRAVAKGARRPGGSYAARLELFSLVDLVLVEGRNLDIVTAAALSSSSKPDPLGVEQSACASVLAELLSAIAQEDLAHARLFDMSEAAFISISNANPHQALMLLCSALLKSLAYGGFRPSFSTCVVCGNRIELAKSDSQVPFSYSEGGVICPSCQRPPDSMQSDATLVQWAEALMLSRFIDVQSFDVDTRSLLLIVQFARQWTRIHVAKDLKAADYLLSSCLF